MAQGESESPFLVSGPLAGLPHPQTGYQDLQAGFSDRWLAFQNLADLTLSAASQTLWTQIHRNVTLGCIRVTNADKKFLVYNPN